MRKLCFVMMPFGQKKDEAYGMVDFDAVYNDLIVPAIEAAGLDPLRADEEQVGGIIHKPMFERLLLCDIAIADLTSANANVYYELGVRHGIRPLRTVLLFADKTRLPFDIAFLRALPYSIGLDGKPDNVTEDDNKGTDIAALTKKLQTILNNADVDSPYYQLLPDVPRPDIQSRKTEEFQGRMQEAAAFTARIATAKRAKDLSALVQVEEALGSIDRAEASLVVELFLAYRRLGTQPGYQRMVDLYAKMDEALRRSIMIREQTGLALNRLGRAEEAEAMLEEVLHDHGPSSETLGILGRVYKDLWAQALKREENALMAEGWLEKAIDAYTRGFEADPRDPFPGINAVTLLDIAGNQERLESLLPVVRYAQDRRLRLTIPDYWDHATVLELAVLARDAAAARRALAKALVTSEVSPGGARTESRPSPFALETTANNLQLIANARRARGEDMDDVEAMIAALRKGATTRDGE